MSDDPAAVPAPPPEPRPPWARRALGTWPRRVGALAGSAVVGWVVSQSLPALWQNASEKVGIAPAPLQVSVVRDPDLITTLDAVVNYMFVVRSPIESVGAPPSGEFERGRYPWGKSLGGVDALYTPVRLVIRGRSDAPVILESLDVEVVRKGAPIRGTLVGYSGQGAGQPVRFFDVDLDRTPPSVSYLKNDTEEVLFPFRVTRSDVEVFDIAAHTVRHDVRWRLRLHYAAADEQGTMTFDDRGRPFETTAPDGPSDVGGIGPPPPPKQRTYAWIDGRWREFGAHGELLGSG